MARRLSGNGGGSAPRAQTITQTVPTRGGVVANASAFGLLAPVGYAKTGGNANLTIAAATGAISAASAIAAGASQALNGTATGADGCVIPFVANLTGQTAAATVPAAPSLSLTPAAGQVSIAWTDGANGGSPITAHNLYRGTAAGGETLVGTFASGSPYVDPGLANGTAYFYKLSAVNAVGEGALSAEASATPASTTVPAAPTIGLTAAAGQVSVAWTDGATGGSAITSHRLYRGTASGGETLVGTIATGSPYVDGGLANGTTYFYKLSAVNAVGEGAQSVEASATPATVPAAPAIGLTAAAGQVSVAWTDGATGGSAITSHKLYRGTASGGETLVGTIATGSPYLDSSLTNGTTYYYKLSAVNALGEGAQSSEASATPQAAYTLPALSTVVYDGDSRTDNTGGRSAVGAGETLTGGYGAGPSTVGWVQAVCGNKWLLGEGFMHAIGGSSSEAMVERAKSTSMATSGNPANARTGLAFDAYYNRDSDGVFTPTTQPGGLVLSAEATVNDSNASFYDVAQGSGHANALAVHSLENLATYADSLLAAGKALLIGNEAPRGRATYQLESRTVAGGTCTATNTGSFVDGESYGAQGVVGQFASGLPRKLTKVASAPGQDQYTVSAAGVYTFGGTAPATVWINYSAAPTSGLIATGDRQRVVNAFTNSSAASYVDPVASVNYGLPGLRKNRPNVIVADTFNALLDTSTGSQQLSLPGTMDTLQLHHTQLGGLKAAKAFRTAFNAAYPSATSFEKRGVHNNWWAARGTGLTTAYAGTLPPSMRSAATGGAPTPTLISVNGVVIGKVDTGSGAISACNGSTAIVSGSLNFTTGAWSIITSSNTAIASATQVWFEQAIGNGTFDTGGNWVEGTIGRNAVMNGMLDLTAASGTNLPSTTGASTITGVANGQVPYGWSLNSAALNTAIANGTATVVVSSLTTADGYPSLTIDIEGTHTANLGVQMYNTCNLPTQRIVAGDKLMAAARITYAAHPTNGGLYGTSGIESRGSLTTGAVSRNGSTGTVSCTGLATRTIDGSNAATGTLIDASLLAEWGGPLDLYRLTPQLDTTGINGSVALTYYATINTLANVPFAGRFQIGQVYTRRRNDV